jgi:acyl-CoA reductase-like NAD-dependent aldehyde dehydrogenase
VSPTRTGEGTESHLVVRAPASGEEIGRVPVLQFEEVRALVQRARAAQPAWAARPVEDRAGALHAFRRGLAARAQEVADLSCRETGRLPFEALLADVLTTCDLARWYARRAPHVLARRRIPSGWLITKKCYELREPFGVVGVIGPWNLPVLNVMRAVLAALVTGNAVVLKPSDLTPFTALLVQRIAYDAGIPEDVFLVATGDATTGAALIRAGVDKISFTGSVESGRRVAQAAAERLVPVSLELGGKDPLIVLPGADLERAANATVAGAFMNAGQLCISIERVFVHEQVYDEYMRHVMDAARLVRVGTASEDADVGALTTEVQVERIEQQMRDAVQRGARVLVGGARANRPGRFFQPTVLADVTPDMLVMREETFGPVLPIMKVRSEEEAVRLANDSGFALGASIWGPRAHAEALVPRIRAGMTCVNDALTNGLVPGLSFGGVGESGQGTLYGDEGLREMSRPRAVLVDRAGVKRELAFFPVSRFGIQRLLALIQMLHLRGARARARALLRLIRGKP